MQNLGAELKATCGSQRRFLFLLNGRQPIQSASAWGLSKFRPFLGSPIGGTRGEALDVERGPIGTTPPKTKRLLF